MDINPGKRLTKVGTSIAVFLILMLLMAPKSFAAEHDDFSYEESGGKITITEYNGGGGAVTIPETIDGKPVVEIDNDAFQSTEITSVVIPKSVAYIGDRAFMYCYDLKYVKFEGEKLPEFGILVFDDVDDAVLECHISQKSKLEYEMDDYIKYNGFTVETFGESEPEPEPEPDPEITPDKAFEFTLGDEGYTIKKYLGGYKSVGIPAEYNGKPVVAIGNNAFENFRAMESVKIPDTITSIGKEAFYNCRALGKIELGKGLKIIGQSAIKYCDALKEIEIPASVEEIAWEGIAYCKVLKNIEVDGDNTKYADIDGVLFDKECKTLINYPTAGRTASHYDIPEGTELIEQNAFCISADHYRDNPLTSVGYPSSLKEIGDRAFRQTNLESVTVFSDIKLGNNVYDLCKNLKTVNIAEGVEVLPNSTFEGVENMETLNLPGTLKVIGDRALERYPLAEIDLPEGLEVIGKDAFANTKLTSVEIPSSVKTLSDRAFYTSRSLVKVTFAENSKLEKIDQYAFSNCSALEEVALPASLKTLGTGAFSSCSNLEGIELPDGLTALQDSVFSGSGIAQMTFPDSVTKMGERTFNNCSRNLEKVTLPKNLEELGEYTFYNCTNLKDAIFPEEIKIRKIPTGSFIDCFGLRKIHLPATIDETDVTAFLNPVTLVVEHDAKMMKRNPLDCHNLVLRQESDYELREDGYYYTTRDIKVGDTGLIEKGYKLVPQKGVTFQYTGSEPQKKEVTAVEIPENVTIAPEGEKGVLVNIKALGAQSGDKVYIKAVGKKFAASTETTGTLALGKGKDKGNLVSIKTLNFDQESLYNDDYEIFASLVEGEKGIQSSHVVKVASGIVPTEDEEKAALADEKIKEIGDITLDSRDAINDARSAYEALTDEQKSFVKELDDLEAAEVKYLELYRTDVIDNTKGYLNIIDLGSYSPAGKAAVQTEVEFVQKEAPKCDNIAMLDELIEKSKEAVSKIKTDESEQIEKALNEAKQDALIQLSENLKNADKYRLTEQIKMLTMIMSANTKIEKAESIDAVQDIIKETQRQLDEIKTDRELTVEEIKAGLQKEIKANVTSSSAKTIKVSWNKIAAATAYEVYMASGTSTDYKLVKTTAGQSFNSTGLKTGTIYKYKVRAYTTYEKEKYAGEYSAVKSDKPVASAPKITVKSGKQLAKASWKKVDGASGYQVYRATSKNGAFKKIKTLGKSATAYTNKKLAKGKTYRYKVRAYTKAGGKTIYGKYSTIKSVKIK